MPAVLATPRTRDLPRLLPCSADADDGGYRRDYEIHARLGRCLLQRVRVHIRYSCGGERLADYRQTYYEFFRFDRDDAALIDVHDFDLLRDGWRQSVIGRLLRRHRDGAKAAPNGEPKLLVAKQFTLGTGAIADASPRELASGASFGMLANGPDGPSRTTLRLARGDGSWVTVDGTAPCPTGFVVQGSGTFTDSSGCRAFECYRHRFATLTGALADRGGYRPHRIPS